VRTISAMMPPGLVALLATIAVAACAGRPLTLPTAPPASIDPSPRISVSPTIAPTPGPGEAAVAGLRDRLGSDGFSYRVALKGDVLATVSDLTLTGAISMSGKDAASAMSYTFASGSRSTVETRIVGGKRWVRVDKGTWKAASYGASHVIDPFSGALAPGAIGDAGPKKVGGKPLRAIEIHGGHLLDLTTIPAYNLTEERVTSALLTIYVDASGKPISGHWIERGQGRVSGQLQEVDVDVDLTFSNVGGSVTVNAP
jgi:hypothetical protein